jgi:hypothetical protein
MKEDIKEEIEKRIVGDIDDLMFCFGIAAGERRKEIGDKFDYEDELYQHIDKLTNELNAIRELLKV